MFKTSFNHECKSLIEACGFKKEYFDALIKSISKIEDNSIKDSFFIEAMENQILGDEKVSSNVRRGIRLLLILVATSTRRNLSGLEAKRIIIKTPKGLISDSECWSEESEEVEELLGIIAEAFDEGIPPEEIEKILEKKFGKGKKKKPTSKSKDKKNK